MDTCLILDIRALPDPAQDRTLLDGLPDERVKKCLRPRFANDRRRSLGAGLLLRRLLAGTGQTLSFSAKGKPEAESLFLNVSHSGDYVLAISGDHPVGCDIEALRPARMHVAERCFSPLEQSFLKQHCQPELAFWQLWTLRESYLKMTGEGLSLPMRCFELRPDAQEHFTLYRDGEPQPCFLQTTVYDRHVLSFCKEGAPLSGVRPVLCRPDVP